MLGNWLPQFPSLPMRKLSVCLRTLFCAQLLCISFQVTATPPTGFDRTAWLQDYAALKLALERDYANLAWFASPQAGVDLPALDRFTLRNLRSAENDTQARLVIQDFVAGFHDGHLSILPTLQASATADAEPPKPQLDRLDASAGCAALGYAPDARVSFSLPFESLPGFTLDSDGISQAFRSGILATSNGIRIGIVRIKSFSRTHYPPSCLLAWSKARATQQKDDAALRETVEAINDDGWYAALAAQLKHLAEQHATLILVDIGNNNGGSDSGDIATRLFTDKPVHSSPLLVSQSPAGDAYLEEQVASLRKGLESNPNGEAERALRESLALFQSTRDSLHKPSCDLTWVWRRQQDWNAGGCHRLVGAGSAGGPLDVLPSGAYGNSKAAEHLHWPIQMDNHWGAWNGPVYVLTNSRTFSAAEMFAATMQNNGIAKIVGERTGGDGCGFMSEAKPITLPHSRIRVRMPNCVRLRADGTDEVAGIWPDLPVLQREDENKRTQAQRVVAAILGNYATRAAGVR